MQWVGKARGGFCLLVAMGNGVVACGDDDHPGQSDGGAGGKATGGSVGSGGKASGGSVGSGGKASGGSGGASGGAASGGNGGATGGDTGASGGSGGQTPSSGGGTTDLDSGMDASVDGSSEGGIPDGSTGSDDGGGPLCPITGTWPVGTYTLNAHVAVHTTTLRTIPQPWVNEEYCSLALKSLTLSITEDPTYPECLDVGLNYVDHDSQIVFCGEPRDQGDVLRLIDYWCYLPSPNDCAYVDIDRTTGAIVGFMYEDLYSPGVLGDRNDLVLTGTGYPRCAATQAAPPVLPAPADSLDADCYYHKEAVPLGCSYTYETQYADQTPAPVCEFASSGNCTCAAVTNEPGRVLKCCPPL